MKQIKLAIILIFLLVLKARAQVTILDTKKLDRIKNGKTYVLVKNMNFPGADKYLDVLQKNWTLTKEIHFMLYSDFGAKATVDDSFLSLELLFETNNINAGNPTTSATFFLAFWTCKERFFRKNRDLKQSDEEVMAKVEISLDAKTMLAKHFKDDLDFDGGTDLHTWSPGMLKNYLQRMTVLLNAGKKIDMHDDFTNKAELSKLTTETLYVPDFNLFKYGFFDAREKSDRDAENLFENYSYAYKVIGKEQLDKLILETDKPFYYLIFIKFSSSKVICVINGKTGETIYSRGVSVSFNLKPGDLKDLYKTIKKS